MIAAAHAWNSTAAERRMAYGCDRAVPNPDDVCYRAVDVRAPREVVFRWLCQLRVAPYSYDWIDNLGRTSPRQLVPGLDDLTVGQPAMSLFELAAFEPGEQLTFALRQPPPLRRLVAVTYTVVPRGPRRSRIAVKLVIRYPSAFAMVRRRVPVLGTALLLGDLVMMRRQLLNLRDLAERTADEQALRNGLVGALPARRRGATA